ncbi:replication initiator protein A [Priestia megaterium]
MSTKKINIKDLNTQEFYQLPKVLIWDKRYREGLSDGAKLLYMIIRDRFSLSIHTAQKQSESGEPVSYQDQNGDIFCVLDNVEISFTLNKAVKTVINYIKELADLNLISITEIAGGANRIYLNQLESNTTSLAHFLGERDFFKHVHSCKKKGKEITKTLEECIKAQVQKRENNDSAINSNTDIPSGEDTTPPGM